ncbi:9936_t:CDS:1, partial [Paraglomus occultum]
SGTDPSQATKQSPNRSLKLDPQLHQHPIGSDHPAYPPVEKKKGKKKEERK